MNYFCRTKDVASQLNDKVDISRIFIHSTDGLGSVARVSSLEAANTVLQGWAHGKAEASGECDVEIVFEDGLRYRGHYRLNDQDKSVSLGRHVRRRLTVMAKSQCIKRNQPPANDSIIIPDKRDQAECAKEMLAHYNI
jgi:hypothetical protein